MPILLLLLLLLWNCLQGVEYYLIKWQGWFNDYNSWEPREHLSDCGHCERAYASAP